MNGYFKNPPQITTTPRIPGLENCENEINNLNSIIIGISILIGFITIGILSYVGFLCFNLKKSQKDFNLELESI